MNVEGIQHYSVGIMFKDLKLLAVEYLLELRFIDADVLGIVRVVEVYEGRNDTDYICVKVHFNVPGGQ